MTASVDGCQFANATNGSFTGVRPTTTRPSACPAAILSGQRSTTVTSQPARASDQARTTPIPTTPTSRTPGFIVCHGFQFFAEECQAYRDSLPATDALYKWSRSPRRQPPSTLAGMDSCAAAIGGCAALLCQASVKTII